MTLLGNPYVGPRAFRLGEAIFGREREIRELVEELVPERLVLLYSPSGAGKTSLIQAGLLPELRQRGFFDLGVARVGREIPAEFRSASTEDSLANRYVLSLLLCWEDELRESEQMSPEDLAKIDLSTYLDRRQEALGPHGSMLLILDQFEEIALLDPTDAQVKTEFFRQLGRALDHPLRWAIFSMREDYLASLDPYLRNLPTRLRTRYRLELLSPRGAREAIRKPAKTAGFRLSEELAASLVEDLRRHRIQTLDGRTENTAGPHVEPVQLQVVCVRMWKHRNEEEKILDDRALEALGDVDSALSAYYADTLRDACADDLACEMSLRRWIQLELISPEGIRAQVLESEATRAVSKSALLGLYDGHLLRKERRRGAYWLELAHDRLVEPIQSDNEAFFQRHQSPLARQASLWQEEGRPQSLLLRGRALRKAKNLQASAPDELTENEHRFLRESEVSSRRRRGLVGLSALLGSACLILLLSWQTMKTSRALLQSQAREIANQGLLAMDEEPGLASLLGLASLHLSDTPTHRGHLIRILENNSRLEADLARPVEGRVLGLSFLEEDQISVSGNRQLTRTSLAGRLLSAIQPTSPPWKVVYSGDRKVFALIQDRIVEMRRIDTGELLFEIRIPQNLEAQDLAIAPDGRVAVVGFSQKGLWEELRPEILWFEPQASTPARRQQLPSGYRLESVEFGPQGRFLAAGAANGIIHLWDTQTGQLVASRDVGHEGPISALAFHPDGKILISGSDDWTVRSWSFGVDDSSRLLYSHEGGVVALRFDPEGRHLLSGARDRVARLWDFDAERMVGTLGHHKDQISAVDTSPDGRHAVTAAIDGQVLLWRLQERHPALGGARSRPSTLAFDPTGVALSILDDRGLLETWDIANLIKLSPEIERSGPAHQHQLIAKAPYAPLWVAVERRTVLTPGNEVSLWETSQGSLISRLKHPFGSSVESLASTGAERHLFTGTADGSLFRWDGTAGVLRGMRPAAHSSAICALAVSPQEELLVSSDVSGRLAFWTFDLEPKYDTEPIAESGVRLCQLAIDPTGQDLATADLAGTLTLWDLGSRAPRVRARIPDAIAHRLDPEISSLAFDRQGEILAVGGFKTIYLWDVGEARQIGPPLRSHGNRVTDLVFSPTESLLASSSSDRVVLWNLSLEHWRERACRQANRNLTPSEWRQYVGPEEPFVELCPELAIPPEEIAR